MANNKNDFFYTIYDSNLKYRNNYKEIKVFLREIDLDNKKLEDLNNYLENDLKEKIEKQRNNSIHKVKALIQENKSFYPTPKFNEANNILDSIFSKLEDNIKEESFNNEINSLTKTVNEVLSYFNSHYWQITGLVHHGEHSRDQIVTPLADPIPLI